MTGQDWLEKDFYAVLGVPKDADAAALKKAYRKLARTLHPDQNPGDAAAEAKFKDVGEAYAILSDPEQRQQYDSLRAMAGGGARFAAGGRGGSAGFEDLFGGMFGGGGSAGGGSRVRYTGHAGGGMPEGLEDILSGMFGGGGGGAGFRSTRGPERGADMQASTALPFREAVEGSTVRLGVAGSAITVRIPPGVHNGQKIRLRGKGEPGRGGGEPGDLVVTVAVEPHPVFSLHGHNLHITVPVTFAEAALGGTIEVPTLDASTVKVKIPAGTPSGRTFRVKGRGAPVPRTPGDLMVAVEIAVPQSLNGKAKAAVEAFAEATAGEDPRADLLARVRA